VLNDLSFFSHDLFGLEPQILTRQELCAKYIIAEIMNIREAHERFATDEQCLTCIEQMRWTDGIVG
jgi:hypothetical protein